MTSEFYNFRSLGIKDFRILEFKNILEFKSFRIFETTVLKSIEALAFFSMFVVSLTKVGSLFFIFDDL